MFVLPFSTIDVENLDIELFMYHVFKVCQYLSIKFAPTKSNGIFNLRLFNQTRTSRATSILSWIARLSRQNQKYLFNG
jgi:hypothetical protein